MVEMESVLLIELNYDSARTDLLEFFIYYSGDEMTRIIWYGFGLSSE